MSQDALSTSIAKRRRMYKVHEQLRGVNENAYKPVLLTIGPYYDQDKIGQGFMTEHKLRYQQQMLRTKGSEERYMRALRELEESARKCYGECNSQTSDQFLKTMLLDGCFIIELFRKYEKYKKTRDEDDPIISTNGQSLKYEAQDPTDEDDPIFQMKWVLPRIARDLLLFENQLPFFILAKLFEMSKGNKTQIRKRPENSGELIIDIVEKERNSGESSTSTDDQIHNLALGFFSEFLPFQWNVQVSSYNSTKRIKELLCLTQKPLNPSLPVIVWKRLRLGFRFRDAKFEHLLGLIHATISISILDTEIGHANERQEAGDKSQKAEKLPEATEGVKFQKAEILLPEATEGVKFQKAEILPEAIELTMRGSCGGEFMTGNSEVSMPKEWKHPYSPKNIEGWKSNLFDLEPSATEGVNFQKAEILPEATEEVELSEIPPKDINLKTILGSCAGEFMTRNPEVSMPKEWKHPYSPKNIEGWKSNLFDELQKAGVDVNMANEFKDNLDKFRRWMKIPYAIEFQEAGIEFDDAKKFKDLHDPNRNDNKERCLKKELHEAGVKSKKAKKFMHLHDLREIEHWNIHGATELEEAGIKFEKADKCNSTFSIKFNKGLMEISPLSIEDHTEAYLRNLIAYEQYCDGDNGFDFDYVTNYVSFMDYLINSPKDVELLRRKGIIRNFLGDDKVTSTMVNKLGHYITISNSSSMYARISMEVNMHCNKRRNLWAAKLKRDYFNSPWAWISFLAAVLLLVLAIVQTIFSIIP